MFIIIIIPFSVFIIILIFVIIFTFTGKVRVAKATAFCADNFSTVTERYPFLSSATTTTPRAAASHGQTA